MSWSSDGGGDAAAAAGGSGGAGVVRRAVVSYGVMWGLCGAGLRGLNDVCMVSRLRSDVWTDSRLKEGGLSIKTLDFIQHRLVVSEALGRKSGPVVPD